MLEVPVSLNAPGRPYHLQLWIQRQQAVNHAGLAGDGIEGDTRFVQIGRNPSFRRRQSVSALSRLNTRNS